MGENPDYRNDDKMMFLRGNFTSTYKRTIDEVRENELSLGYDPSFINNRTGLRGITISTNTGLFFPVSNMQFVINDRHEGTELGTSYDCRVAARKDFSKGAAMWANYSRITDGKVQPKKPIVEKLMEYYAESSPFTLIVSELYTLPQDPQFMLQPGPHKGVDVGVYLLIPSLPEGLWRIDFGIISRAYYLSRACYDIRVIKSEDMYDVPDRSLDMPMFPEPLPSLEGSQTLR